MSEGLTRVTFTARKVPFPIRVFSIDPQAQFARIQVVPPDLYVPCQSQATIPLLEDTEMSRKGKPIRAVVVCLEWSFLQLVQSQIQTLPPL